MFTLVVPVVLNLLLCQAKIERKSSEEDKTDEDFGTNLVASMRNDANLDLSADEEYEDLRAELLAYHTALASLSSNPKRRSMISTPCWTLGGICVDYKLCTGFRYLTEVPGCKDRLMVCCFAWNRYKVKDMRDQGLGTLALPWSDQIEFGGLGVVEKAREKKPKKKKPKKRSRKPNKQHLNMVFGDEGEESEMQDEIYDESDSADEEIFGRNRLENSNKTKPVAFIVRANK